MITVLKTGVERLLIRWSAVLSATLYVASIAQAQAGGTYFDAQGDAVVGGFYQAAHGVDVLKYETSFNESAWIWRISLKADPELGLSSQLRPVRLSGVIGFGNGTAEFSMIDEFRGYVGAPTMHLNESFFIDIGTEGDEPGIAKIFDGGGPNPIGAAQISFDSNMLVVRVRRDVTPFSALQPTITSSLVIGDSEGFSDAAPEFEVAVAAPVPEPMSICALGIGSLCLWRRVATKRN